MKVLLMKICKIQSIPPIPLRHPHLNGQNPLSMKKVFCRCFLTNLFFETQTNLNSSSSNSNSFYILRSNTIADKCTLVKDLRVNFFNSVSSSPPSFLSQPWRNLYIFISWRYFIPNDWKQIYIYEWDFFKIS